MSPAAHAPADLPFDCARAGALLLDQPATSARGCEALLPGFWRVVFDSLAVPPGTRWVRGVLWDGGRVSNVRGDAALGQYLCRVDLSRHHPVTPEAISLLLDTLDGAPGGFQGDDVIPPPPAGDDHPHTGTAFDLRRDAGVHRDPFRVVLIRVGWRRAPRTFPAVLPGGNPQSPSPPGPTPPPHPQGPPGAYAPPVVGRATLTLEATGHWTWRVERTQYPGQPWEPVETLILP